MTREEFKRIVKKLRGAYINCPINSQAVFDEWHAMLGDMSYGIASRNADEHIKTCKYPPTIAEIRREGASPFSNFTERHYDMDRLELALSGIRPIRGMEELYGSKE